MAYQGIENIANYKRKATVEVLGLRIGKVLQKYKMGKYTKWHIQRDDKEDESSNHKVIWEIDNSKIAEAQRLAYLNVRF